MTHVVLSMLCVLSRSNADSNNSNNSTTPRAMEGRDSEMKLSELANCLPGQSAGYPPVETAEERRERMRRALYIDTNFM